MVRAGPHQVAHAHSDQRLGSAISNDSTSRQQSPLSDFTNVQADLGLCCPYMPLLPLSHNTTLFHFYWNHTKLLSRFSIASESFVCTIKILQRVTVNMSLTCTKNVKRTINVNCQNM